MMNHATTEVFFKDVEVPQEDRIGVEGRGFRYIIDGMNAERVLIAAECIGDAQNQGIQFPIARCYAETQAAAVLLSSGTWPERLIT